MWMVRAGAGSSYFDYFLNNQSVAVGWGEVGEIRPSDSVEDIRRRFQESFPGDNSGWHIVPRFIREVAIDDSVATYDNKSRLYYIGTIESEAKIEFRTANEGSGAYNRGEYVRKVNWRHQVSRDVLSADARNRLGGQLTLFRLATTTSRELSDHCNGKIDPDGNISVLPLDSDSEETLGTGDILREYIAKSDQFVEDQIASLDWSDLQELVAGILRAMDYRTTVSGRGPDRGVDVFASPDGLGLAEPRIFVEVKHRRGTIGAPALRSFLGGRHAGDRCLYVSTGGFTNEARYEADRSQIPLTLLTLPDLRELLVSYYENLDSETRALVPLKRVYWPVSV